MPSRIAVYDPTREALAPLAVAIRQCCDSRVDEIAGEGVLLSEIADQGPDLVLVDWTPETAALLGRLRAVDRELPVVVSAAAGDVLWAQQAIDAGATDVLVRGDRLAARVRTLLRKVVPIVQLVRDNRSLRDHLAHSHAAPILAESDAMRRVVRAAEAVAPIRRPVLVLGERGTGKELVARHIHGSGPGRGRPFVVVNCASLTDTLLESELFGHERGAFTGAERRRVGWFEAAHSGTLFLDEIGHMSLSCQQAILRVVEYGTIRRIGAVDEVRVDVRIVGATNADLQEKMDRGEFLRDLYDRLSFEVIVIPPLRERPADIGCLAESFLRDFSLEFLHGAPKRLTAAALAALVAHPLPGNVRELKTVIERAAFHDTDGVIDTDDLGLTAGAAVGAAPRGFKERLAALEAELIARALAEAGGNQAAAARALGLSYHQLRYFVRKHGLG